MAKLTGKLIFIYQKEVVIGVNNLVSSQVIFLNQILYPRIIRSSIIKYVQPDLFYTTA